MKIYQVEFYADDYRFVGNKYYGKRRHARTAANKWMSEGKGTRAISIGTISLEMNSRDGMEMLNQIASNMGAGA